MKLKTRIRLFLLLLATVAVGCQHSDATQKPANNANSTPTSPQAPFTAGQSSTAPSDASPATPGAPQQSGPPTQLVGTYTISEVHNGGVVTMISQATTQFVFGPGADFVRISKAPGKRDFKDSGQFSIEGDQLVLKIVMSAGKVQKPIVEKRHQFALSADGSEMKLTSKDGKVAVFRK